MDRLFKKPNTVIFSILFVLALIIRISFSYTLKFDGLYGQDAYAYFDWSREFISYISNFQIPPKFFYWPVGYFIFSAIMNLLCFGSLSTSILLLSMISGSLLAGLMYLLTFELLKNYYDTLKSKKYSILAGLIVCFAGSAVRSSIVVMSDALGLVLLTMGMLMFLKYFNNSKRYQLMLSFVFFSFGIMVRYANSIIIIAVLVCMIYMFKISANRKNFFVDFVLSSLAALIVFIPELYYISDYGISYFNYEGTVGTWASAWNPLNFFKRDFITFDGANNYKLQNGLFFLSPVFHPMYLFLFGITFLWGIVQAIRRKFTPIILFCFTWIIVYYIYFAGCPYQSIRYTLSYFPPLIVISVFGFSMIKLNYRPQIRYALIAIVLLAGWTYNDIGKLNEQKHKELEVVSWVNSNITGDPALYSFGITGALKHYTGKHVREFFNYNKVTLKNEIDSAGGEVYFILPVGVINTQWSARPLKELYDYLMINYKPVEKGKADVYTIFRIDR